LYSQFDGHIVVQFICVQQILCHIHIPTDNRGIDAFSIAASLVKFVLLYYYVLQLIPGETRALDFPAMSTLVVLEP
jgi:hypothetical protein